MTDERTGSLPALLGERTREALTAQAPLLRELSAAIGGPFHGLFADRFDSCVAEFRQVATEADVPLRVFYAKKANKASVWARRAAELGIGVDVSSTQELGDALGQGVRGSRIVVTGPAKSSELLRLALLHGCLVAVDALDELGRLIGLVDSLARVAEPARILLRARPHADPQSRFGLDEDELDAAAGWCARAPTHLDLCGFSVHLAGYAITPRAAEADRLVARCVAARRLGLDPRTVSIGGGFPVDYVDAEAWDRFSDAAELFHADRRFADFYPYHSPLPGAEALRAVLATPAADGLSVGGTLRAHGITLMVEPGRALLDQAGFTVFGLQGVKDRGDYVIATVDGTSLSLSEQWFASEFLPEPVLLSREPGEAGDEPTRVSVGGASCLESDMVTWRKVLLPRRPRHGDLLVYPNTAGYQMDSNESEFHELPLPPKVVLESPGATPRWRFDRTPR